MKLVPTPVECSDIILGAYAGASFYNTFDKILYDRNIPLLENQIDNETIDRINELLTKIQSHWNKQNSEDFKSFAIHNIKLLNNLLERPNKYYKDFIHSINFKGIQNTKISKLLHVLKPNEFPMLDPAQGEFLLGSYRRNSKTDLINAIDAFHNYHKNNLQKAFEIERILTFSYGINISCLRVSEILLWVQTQLNIKDMKKVIIKKI